MIQDEGADPGRVKELRAIVEKCTDGIKKYIPEKPKHLTIYAYGSRAEFVQGLKREFGYPDKWANFFKKSGAPRPQKGKMLVPGDQESVSVCHEIVHHVVEGVSSKEAQLNAMWFDEGTASYISDMIYLPKRVEGAGRWLKKQGSQKFIPTSELQTHDQWMKNMNDGSIIYTESKVLLDFFFKKYAIRKFRRLLKLMKKKPFDQAFKQITGISSMQFYNEWLETMK